MSREFSTSVALAASIGAAVGILLYLMLDDAANRYQASRELQIIASEIRDQSIAAGAAAASEIRTEETTTGQDPRRKLTIYMPERAADEFISQIESRTDVEIYTKSSRSTLPSHLTIDIYITMGA